MKQFAKYHFLSPIALVGTIVPDQTHFKLVCAGGVEYVIDDNSKARAMLPIYCWKEVKIVGLLNNTNQTLIPQKVFPKGPDGESSNVIDLPLWQSQNLKRKVLNKINELVVVPAAVLAVLAS